MKNLNIQDPCKEDFSKMTETERGHFCGKCQIDVFDFTDKSNSEIKSILLSNSSTHVCGRIKESSLESLNLEFLAWENQNTRSFQSRFVFALIMVFGLGLFSCNEKEEKALGDFASQSTVVSIQAIDEENNLFLSLDQKIEENIEYLNSEALELIEDVDIKINDLSRGDNEVPISLSECEFTRTEYMVAGGLSWDPSYEEYLVETAEIDTTLITEVEIETIETASFINAQTYPNPTSGNASLVVNVQEYGQFDIDLYSMTGSKVMGIYSGDLDEGRQEFRMDLGEFQNGTYLIIIKTEDIQETLKIQKMQ